MKRADIAAFIDELGKIAERLETMPAKIEQSAKERYGDLTTATYPYQVGGLQQTMTSAADDLRRLLAQMKRGKL